MLLILAVALIFLLRVIWVGESASRHRPRVEVVIAVAAIVFWVLNFLEIVIIRGNPVGW